MKAGREGNAIPVGDCRDLSRGKGQAAGRLSLSHESQPRGVLGMSPFRISFPSQLKLVCESLKGKLGLFPRPGTWDSGKARADQDQHNASYAFEVFP